MKPKYYYVKQAAITVFVVLALLTPVAAILPQTQEDISSFSWSGKEKQEIIQMKTWKQETPIPLTTGDDIQITGWTEGDSRRPSITQDSQGNIFITWQHDVDLFQSALGTTYNDDPQNQEVWWEHGIISTITSGETIVYPDTALCEHPDFELLGVYVTIDTEQVCMYSIPDVTNPDTWNFWSWVGGDHPEPEFAAIADGGWYDDTHYPEINGPYNFYIYHEMYESYDIPSCPICSHSDLDDGSCIQYFDGQQYEKTAPAADADMVNLEDRMHTIIYNTETNKITWKKIDPTVDSDYEFTPFQATIADGTNPSIAAFDTTVAVMYMNDGQIEFIRSTDDGATWEDAKTIGPGLHPDIYAMGSILYAAYINNGNLYRIVSKDGGITWSEATQINDVEGTVVAEDNAVDVYKAGIVWVDNRNDRLDIYYTTLSSGPKIPEINGPTQGRPNKEYTFNLQTTDPDEDDVFYFIDWGDGTDSGWLGPYSSGEEISASKTWNSKELFTIKAKAKDTDDAESGWVQWEFSTPKHRGNIRSLLAVLIKQEGMFSLLSKLLKI